MLMTLLLSSAVYSASADLHADICVYGASAGGIAAAVQAARLGRTVVLIEPGLHPGGMSVEGLGGSDIDNHGFRNSVVIGGLAREFYRRIGRAYGKADEQWTFEPHVAERTIAGWLSECPITILRGHWLAEDRTAVSRQSTTLGPRLSSIRLDDGTQVSAGMFIDATIEGDLLAAAGVSTVIGREPNTLYGETKNGIRGVNTYRQFTVRVDPFRIPGDSASGLIPTIQDEPLGTPGDGDHRIQAYCFRLCFTKQEANRIPFQRPVSYDPGMYEIYRRYAAAGGSLWTPHAGLPNGKTDQGSWHDLSANLYGMNHGYPGGDRATRQRIVAEHLAFTQGLCWFLANDPALPADLRSEWSRWGVCKDEFTDHDGWPRMFYVRDARRLVNDHVLTEHHTRRTNQRRCDDPVGVAYWPPDTHHVRRFVRDGAAYNEGFVFGGDDWAPFGISYRSLVPRQSEAVNLLTPTCPASSHVAYGAIRLEWPFMILGQSCATAAVLALERETTVQQVDYSELRRRLVADGLVLDPPPFTAK